MSTKTNEEIVAELEAKANAAETEDNVAQSKVKGKFNPKELTAKTKMVRTLYDEDLGEIDYVLLNYGDINEINQMTNSETKKPLNTLENSIQLLFKQLSPANKELTISDLENLPHEVTNRLLSKLQGEGSFFFKPTPKQKKLKTG
jgi:hypothetical protein